LRVLGFISRALLFFLVARMAALPPTRRVGGPDQPDPDRVLLRYCAGPGSRWSPVAVAQAGGRDPGAAVSGSVAERGLSPEGASPGAWFPASPPASGFLTRPPSHLRC
jgi:hypothetical protein